MVVHAYNPSIYVKKEGIEVQVPQLQRKFEVSLDTLICCLKQSWLLGKLSKVN